MNKTRTAIGRVKLDCIKCVWCVCVCEQIDIAGGCLTTLLCCLPLTPELFRCSLNISSRDADKLMSLNIPSSLDVN